MQSFLSSIITTIERSSLSPPPPPPPPPLPPPSSSSSKKEEKKEKKKQSGKRGEERRGEPRDILWLSQKEVKSEFSLAPLNFNAAGHPWCNFSPRSLNFSYSTRRADEYSGVESSLYLSDGPELSGRYALGFN
jgi:hypothetical protein